MTDIDALHYTNSSQFRLQAELTGTVDNLANVDEVKTEYFIRLATDEVKGVLNRRFDLSLWIDAATVPVRVQDLTAVRAVRALLYKYGYNISGAFDRLNVIYNECLNDILTQTIYDQGGNPVPILVPRSSVTIPAPYPNLFVYREVFPFVTDSFYTRFDGN